MARKKKIDKLQDMRWWDAPEDEAVAAMGEVARQIRHKQFDRTAMYLHFARLYYGFGLQGLDPNTYMDEPDPLDSEPLSTNLVRMVVKSAIPRVCKSSPRVMLLTQAGKWSERVRAHRAEQVIAGDFDRAGVYRRAKTMVRDSAIFGTSAIRVYERSGRPAYDRIYPWQICVDQRDGYYGEPRNLYYWQYIDRRVLAALYPEQEEEIMNAPIERDSSDPLDIYEYGDQDQLLVWHGWHLPSGKDSDDGLYLCGVGQDIKLERTEWKEDTFPFVVFRWDEPVIGFWGEGLAREVSGHQYEIGAITRAIRISLRHAVPRTYVPRGSQIMTSDLDDRIGTIIEYVGAVMPATLSPQPIHETFLMWLNAVKQDGLQSTGVSQMAAFSKQPTGITAAKALQLMDDVEDTRFLAPAEAWERAIVELGRHTIRVRREIASAAGEEKPLTAWESRRKTWRTVSWRDVELDEASYHLRTYPVAQLPSTPAGKTDLVESWFQSGTISPEERRQLLDLPDVEAYSDLQNAPYDWVWFQIEKILMDGESQTPDPTVGPELPIKLGRGAYIAALRDGCPDGHLQLMRDYLDQCVVLQNMTNPVPLQQIAQIAQPQMAAPTGLAGQQAAELATPEQMPPPPQPGVTAGV